MKKIIFVLMIAIPVLCASCAQENIYQQKIELRIKTELKGLYDLSFIVGVTEIEQQKYFVVSAEKYDGYNRYLIKNYLLFSKDGEYIRVIEKPMIALSGMMASIIGKDGSRPLHISDNLCGYLVVQSIEYIENLEEYLNK